MARRYVQLPVHPYHIDRYAWEDTPTIVKQYVSALQGKISNIDKEYEAKFNVILTIVEELERKVADLEAENAKLSAEVVDLRERVRQNSRNSSKPPSSDGPDVPPRARKPPSGKRRGGQPGHPAHPRRTFDSSECRSSTDCFPTSCRGCGQALTGTDSHPFIHQVIDLPEIRPLVDEFRLHSLQCQSCGISTRAVLPNDANPTGFGPNLTALVNLLLAGYRTSFRMTQRLLDEVFSIPISLGSLVALQRRASDAIAGAVESVAEHVRTAPVRMIDETGWRLGTSDGARSEPVKGWLWSVTTPEAVLFEIATSRAAEIARRLLGDETRGVVISDRYSAYSWIAWHRHQVCLGHLLRDFQKIAERASPSKEIGEVLVQQLQLLFHHHHRFRDRTLRTDDWRREASRRRTLIRHTLKAGRALLAEVDPTSEQVKTAHTCARVLKSEPKLYLFVRNRAIEPTSNDVERALRHAVIWRRVRFGSESEAGATAVGRMLTVVMTLRRQQRNLFVFLRESMAAAMAGTAGPSLLPVRG